MSQPSSSLRRFLQAFSNSLEPKPASLIYAFGVIAWIAGMIVLGLRAGENGLSYALLNSSHAVWQSAFLWSVLAVAVAALAYAIKAKRPLLSVLAYAIVYTSPYALFLLGVWVLDTIHFQHPATVEALSMLNPILAIFYIIGIAYMRMRASREKEEAHLFFLLPTFTVVILLLGLTTYRLVSSNEYIYRDAFQLAIQSVNRSGDPIRVDCTLTLNKAGNYDYSAACNQVNPLSDSTLQPLNIQWGNGGPPPSKEGEYRLSIAIPQSAAAQRHMPPDLLPDDFGGPELYLQISLQDPAKKTEIPLRNIPIWLADFAPQ